MSLVRIPMTFFPPPPPHRRRGRSGGGGTTVVGLSRWNNANAEPFNRGLRTQREIELDLRLSRLYLSANRIASRYEDEEGYGKAELSPFRSLGTPSLPSRPSVPAFKSKYSSRSRHTRPHATRRLTDAHAPWRPERDAPGGSTRLRLGSRSGVGHATADGSYRGDDVAEDRGFMGDGVAQDRGFGGGDVADDRGPVGGREGSCVADATTDFPRESRRHGSRFGDGNVATDVGCKGDDVAEDRGLGGGDVATDRGFRDSGIGRDHSEDSDDVARDMSFGCDDVVQGRGFGNADVAGGRGFGDHPAEGRVFGRGDAVAMGWRFRDSVVWRDRSDDSDDVAADNDIWDHPAKGKRYRRSDDVATNWRFRDSSTMRDRSEDGGRGGDVAVRAAKYFKNVKPLHPAFRRFRDSVEKREDGGEEGVRVSEDGVSYMVGGAPFEFMYSYTETPKVKPVRLREPPVAPFGPTTMDRPWTGRKPLAKKKLPEFDSFKLPPPHKKGVKPVQSPGPFLPGSGPKYVHSREEILGEPLSKKEIEELVNGCRKSRRQMHMGRDGLTHNMLENIHAHWKRRRLCKIKCLGVCTVDMDNVRQQLEEKTGGKVIYGSGGVIYLFRGRNYNYKTRPRYPLMLWKPVTPVYPRLVRRIPDGLTLEEASIMRKKGRNLIPICKLGKNGVYSNLVKDVREAFEACDMVRINCQGLNSSDYHKIGAKLKDLVPCVLLSFEREHILMWRGKEWTSSLPKLGETPQIVTSEFEATLSSTSDSEDEGITTSLLSDSEDEKEEVVEVGGLEDEKEEIIEVKGLEDEGIATSFLSDSEDEKEETVEVEGLITEEDSSTSSIVLDSFSETDDIKENEISTIVDDHARNNIELTSLWVKGVQLLLKEAVDNGAAVILDNSNLDSDIVFQTALSLAKSAPCGPVFKNRRRKTVVKKSEKEKKEDLKVEEVLVIEDNSRESAKKNTYRREMAVESVKADYTNVVPQGSLRVDELAKLLA